LTFSNITIMPASTVLNPKSSFDDGPRRVPLSAEEKANGCYSVPNLQMALEGLHQDGMVILRDLVDPEHCDKVYEHMIGDRDRILETRHKDAEVYNQGVKCKLGLERFKKATTTATDIWDLQPISYKRHQLQSRNSYSTIFISILL
jgi:hypothetical protein